MLSEDGKKIYRVLDEKREEHPQCYNSCCGITLFLALIVSFNFAETEWIKTMWYMYVFPGGSMVKNLSANAGDTEDVGLIPRSGRSPGVGNGNPLQYYCLENPIDSSPPGSPVPGILKARTLEWVAISFSRGSSIPGD